MPFVDVIARKRDGQALSRDDITRFVGRVSDGTLPDYQTSALLMAILLRGMDADETAWLTEAMIASGERVDLSDIPGPKVGKHSTGGVGDKVSIALAPVAAACGVVVPKMSGRGLGHTGGTLDKLESIPGFRVDLTIDEFKAVLRRVGASIIGQSAALAPADRKLYALRDVTATIESIPLIASSIMSKKLAEGSTALLLDVKCGSGAFMKRLDEARALAQAMVRIGTAAGVSTEAFITRMDAPLGAAVGNAIEIEECIRLLEGGGPPDLRSLVTAFACRMCEVAGVAGAGQAESIVNDALVSGRALERLRQMIALQGGDPRIVDDPSRLPRARHRRSVRAERAGVVAGIDAGRLGRSAAALGAGRERVEDAVDHGVGIRIRARAGDRVEQGDEILELLFNDTARADAAEPLARSAVTVADAAPPERPVLIEAVS